MILPFDPAPWVAAAVALLSLGLFASHALDAGEAYAIHRDDRAALELLMALTQTAASVGLTIAALAPFLHAVRFAAREDLRNVGFGIVAGALLVTSGTLFLIDRTMPRQRR
ncbi:MAG TPA: hypothetical protein VGK17_02105 [Propionicimonas sp.]|jgi:hypothetical protein